MENLMFWGMFIACLLISAMTFYIVVEKVIYKESPTARLPDYHNNNNDGKLIKWIKTKRYTGGKVWAKRI